MICILFGEVDPSRDTVFVCAIGELDFNFDVGILFDVGVDVASPEAIVILR